MSLRPITIVGGGISGLSLGIDLQLKGLPVHLFEAGDYPRHRVCGEFLSGQGYRQLQEWGWPSHSWRPVPSKQLTLNVMAQRACLQSCVCHRLPCASLVIAWMTAWQSISES